MNPDNKAIRPSKDTATPEAVRKRMVQVVVQLVLLGVCLFVSAGTIKWFWAWVYISAGVLILLVNVIIIPPELIAERGQVKEGVKRWDRIITGLTMLPTLALPLVAGLDERFGWSPELAIMVHLAGLILFLLGQGLFSWAMATNKYFSTSVRIQYDRQHVTITLGPYRFIRHPGYLGYNIFTLGSPLLLGSLWALIPAGIVVALLVVRTTLEDQTLQKELTGYRQYAEVVPYRLLPFVW